MPVLEGTYSKVTHFIKKLPGGSQPVLVQAEDDLLYVAKFADNLQGTNLPFNESMGAELYRACGLTVPLWKPLLLTDEFLERSPGAWMQTEQGLQRPSAGLCFGSRYLGADKARLYEILPSTAFHRVCNRADFWLSWLIDVCADHTDNRQALFLEGADGQLLSYFIDHGHLFGGPGSGRGAKTHFAASRYLDARIYPQLSSRDSLGVLRSLECFDMQPVRRRLSAIPDAWKTASALDSLDRCLERLADHKLLENLLEMIADSVAAKRDMECTAGRRGYKAGSAVACPRPPDRGTDFALFRLRATAGGQRRGRGVAVPCAVEPRLAVEHG